MRDLLPVIFVGYHNIYQAVLSCLEILFEQTLRGQAARLRLFLIVIGNVADVFGQKNQLYNKGNLNKKVVIAYSNTITSLMTKYKGDFLIRLIS